MYTPRFHEFPAARVPIVCHSCTLRITFPPLLRIPTQMNSTAQHITAHHIAAQHSTARDNIHYQRVLTMRCAKIIKLRNIRNNVIDY
mmetsp:Transcript_12436/g.25329  ORF Transcript_12436/g.25329 Transcript_12436/m.25329 type:complete len:87 (+) Transcript_12436:672-932(+)